MKLTLSLSLISISCLSACSLNNNNHPENIYMHAKSLPALKIPKQLRATTKLQPSFEVPSGPLLRNKALKPTVYPPQFVKV